MVKRIATALLACVVTAVVADWHAVFGMRTMRRTDFVHLMFTPVDERAQSPIADARITYTRPMPAATAWAARHKKGSDRRRRLRFV